MKALELLVAALAASPLIASASTLTFDLDTVFTGGTPGGTTPWITAVFDDSLDAFGADGVQLKLTAANLLPGEFVTQWAFNLNTALIATDLTFTQVTNATTGLVVPGGISTSVNAENALGANGLKNFDITFNFPGKNQPAGNRFELGDVFIVDISRVGGLVAGDFDYINVLNGVAHTGAHIQGIYGMGEDSSKIVGDGGGGGGGSIPEPSTYAAFAGLAALALGFGRRRQAIG